MTDGLHSFIDEDRESEEEFLAAFEAAEAAAVQVLRDALPALQSIGPPSEELYAATYRLRTGLRGGEWPYEHVLCAVGWSSERLPEDDTELWLGAVGALISPREDPGLDAQEEAAIIALEPADWVGSIIGVVREGVGADVSPEALVGYIDACPEVEGVVDPDETPLVETAFELILPAWEAAGAVDENKYLTPLGRWGLPRALAWAFDHDFDDGPVS
jgi:hypothetical protein